MKTLTTLAALAASSAALLPMRAFAGETVTAADRLEAANAAEATARQAKSEADSAEATAQSAFNTAEAAYNAAEGDAKAAAKTELSAAKTALTAAKAAAKTAGKAVEKAEKATKTAKAAADKEASKLAAEAAKAASKQPEQNGITRPKEDSQTGKAWAIFDDISNKNGSPASIGETLPIATGQGINEATVRTQYARWRKFHGISGRIEGPAKETPPAPPAGNEPPAPPAS